MAEVPQMEMRARLSADTAEFTRGMQQASQSADQFIQTSNRLRGAMVGIGVASAAAITTLIGLGTKSFMAAARVDELDVAMNAVGKATGLGYQAIKDAALATKDMGIEMEIAQQSAIKFAQNNLDLAYASQLARAAQDLAVVSGKNSTETFNMLTHAVITGRSEVLKSVGIQKSAGQMYEAFAKSIGKSASALTYQEKQTAVATGALKEAAKVAGTYEAAMTSPGKVLRSFARITNDIQVSLGDMLLKGIGPIVFHLYEFYKNVSKAISTSVVFRTAIEAVKQVLIKLTAPIVTFLQKMTDIAKNFTKVSTAAGEVKSNFDPVGDSVKKLAGAIEFALPAIASMMAMFATFAGAAIFANVPILGTILGGLAGPIGIITVGLVTLYLTSSQVRNAVNNLITSMKPFLSVIVKVGKFLAVLGGYAVAILAKAINGLAKVIRSVTGFFEKHSTVAKALTGIVLTLVGAFIAYKAALILIPAIQAAVAFTSQLIGVAQVIMSGGQLAAIASTNGLAASMLKLNATMYANPIGLIVGAIVALVIAFGFAWKESETFREVMTKVFDFVAMVVGKVLGFIFKLFGNLLIGFGNLIDINNTFGKVVAKVIQFVYQAYLTWYIFIVKAIKSVIDAWLKVFDNQTIFAKIVAGVINFVIGVYATWNKFVLGVVKSVIDAFLNLFKTNETFRTLVETVFNVVIKIIAHAVTVIVMVLANIIKVIATLIYYFEQFGKFIAEIWGNVVAAIDKAKEFIGNIFKKIGDALGNLVDWVKDKFADMFEFIARQADKIPDWLGGGKVADQLNKLAASVRGVKEESGKSFLDKMGDAIAAGAKKAIDLVSAIDKKLIDASKSWGNYEDGAAGALSKIANKMLDFSAKVTEFSDEDNGSKIVAGLITAGEKTSTILGTMIKGFTALKEMKFGDKYVEGLVKGANVASDGLGKVISGLEKMKNLGVGEFIVKNTSEAAVKAGKFLLGLGLGIESFTNKDFTKNVGTSISDLLKSLKSGLGFGDIVEEEKKKYNEAGKIADDTAAEALEKSANRMKTIREAMQAGIDSIKGVLDDLRNAAHDFANSLKDTIVGFAGLKGVELPDGFIPKAKSLIENMNQRLNKSVQFASQIAQLQAMNLDAGALKDIIEAGPVKGAQLAASILGGGQAAVNEISSLQKAIEYSGAAIGQMGSDAAFGGLITNAQSQYDRLTSEQLKTSSKGNVVNISQGAFQVTVNTAGMNDEEQLKAITDKIQETFAILAKELAAK